MTQLVAFKVSTLAELRRTVDRIALYSLHDVSDDSVYVTNAVGGDVRLVVSEEKLTDGSLVYKLTLT